MSTIKVNEVRHLSNTGTENIRLDSNATTNLQSTTTLGLTVGGTLDVSGLSTLEANTIIGDSSTNTLVINSTVSGSYNYSGFTGEIRMYAGNHAATTPPAGWLYCNGNTIGQTSGNHTGVILSALFTLLSDTNDWGNTGNENWSNETVKLPDFRSRSPVGVGTGAIQSLGAGLTLRALSATTGTETHALTIAELAVHTHATVITGSSSTGVTANQSGHTHTFTSDGPSTANTSSTTPGTVGNTTPGSTGNTTPGTGGTTTPGSTGTTTPGSTGTEANHNHTLYHSTHSGDSPTQQYGIGAGWSGSWGQTFTDYTNINAAGAHSHSSAAHSHSSASHTHTGASHSHSSPTHTHTSVAHTHTLSSHTHTGTTDSTDPNITITDTGHTHSFAQANAENSGTSAAGTAHTILSPIIAVNYIIKI